jgi:pyruvate carboxylase
MRAQHPRAHTDASRSYPDNVVQRFINLAAEAGIDVFRIFDCFNCLDQMRLSIDTVVAAGKVAEVAICFTGDFLSTKEKKYTLEYYAGWSLRLWSCCLVCPRPSSLLR